jgi:site-specific recombinase XerD
LGEKGMNFDLAISEKTIISLETNPAAVYLAHLTKTGREGMKWSLDQVAKILTNDENADCFHVKWENVRFQHTSIVQAILAEKYSSATANHALCGLRGTMKRAWLLGLVSAEDYMRTVQVERVTGSTLLSGQQLTFQEIDALMKACAADRKKAGRRDAAILTVLYVGGLRREEVTKVKLSEYDPETGRLLVHGKENKQRNVYLMNEAGNAMADWLTVRGTAGEYIFTPILKNEKVNMRVVNPISPEAIFNICHKRGIEAGIVFSPHDLRRTCVSDMLARGIDLATVSEYVGHNDPKTTLRYDLRNEERKKDAAAMLHIPYDRYNFVTTGNGAG